MIANIEKTKIPLISIKKKNRGDFMQEALYTFTNGLYVIGACHHPYFAGALVDALTQISANPPMVMLSMMNHSHTKSCIDKTNEFSISVLPEDISPFVVANFGFQSGANIKKWEQIDYVIHKSLPYIPNALAQIRARVVDVIIYPHNTLYIAEVIETYDKKEGQPLTYKYYREHLKPICQTSFNNKSSCKLENAPQEKGIKPLNIHKTWTCTLCRYEYEGEQPFEDLPPDWRCPLCGVGKEMFELK